METQNLVPANNDRNANYRLYKGFAFLGGFETIFEAKQFTKSIEQENFHSIYTLKGENYTDQWSVVIDENYTDQWQNPKTVEVVMPKEQPIQEKVVELKKISAKNAIFSTKKWYKIVNIIFDNNSLDYNDCCYLIAKNYSKKTIQKFGIKTITKMVCELMGYILTRGIDEDYAKERVLINFEFELADSQPVQIEEIVVEFNEKVYSLQVSEVENIIGDDEETIVGVKYSLRSTKKNIIKEQYGDWKPTQVTKYFQSGNTRIYLARKTAKGWGRMQQIFKCEIIN